MISGDFYYVVLVVDWSKGKRYSSSILMSYNVIKKEPLILEFGCVEIEAP